MLYRPQCLAMRLGVRWWRTKRFGYKFSERGSLLRCLGCESLGIAWDNLCLYNDKYLAYTYKYNMNECLVCKLKIKRERERERERDIYMYTHRSFISDMHIIIILETCMLAVSRSFIDIWWGFQDAKTTRGGTLLFSRLLSQNKHRTPKQNIPVTYLKKNNTVYNITTIYIYLYINANLNVNDMFFTCSHWDGCLYWKTDQIIELIYVYM